ncbi:MAG: hypothetical protein EOO27_02360 [Comamonadaceae bacterium]|nr:MAG: hypothetical protein EOO27_02360 [Comamonadaceae bacterium]
MIQPLGKNIVATIKESKNITAAGIHLPEGSPMIALEPKTASIIAVGDEVTKVKAGQDVVFKPFAPYEVKDSNKELVIIEEEDILGIVK